MNLTLDIETLPPIPPSGRSAEQGVEWIREYLLDAGLYEAPEPHPSEAAHAKWASKLDKTWRALSLDPLHGRILCIGYAIDTCTPETIYNASGSIEGERDLLQTFATMLHRRCGSTGIRSLNWYGWNHISFDLPFLMVRGLRHDMASELCRWLPWGEAPWKMRRAIDIYRAYVGPRWRPKGGLKDYARTLLHARRAPDGGIADGSVVLDQWVAGHHEQICEYCAGDVINTRKLAIMAKQAGMY